MARAGICDVCATDVLAPRAATALNPKSTKADIFTAVVSEFPFGQANKSLGFPGSGHSDPTDYNTASAEVIHPASCSLSAQCPSAIYKDHLTGGVSTPHQVEIGLRCLFRTASTRNRLIGRHLLNLSLRHPFAKIGAYKAQAD
jgi:hypothetical protein